MEPVENPEEIYRSGLPRTPGPTDTSVQASGVESPKSPEEKFFETSSILNTSMGVEDDKPQTSGTAPPQTFQVLMPTIPPMIPIPHFDGKDPDLWIEMVEARLLGYGIKEEDFYRRVRMDMPKQIAQKKAALLKPTEGNDNWGYFKEQLKTLFCKSRMDELEEVMGKMSLEDKTPTEVMEHMIKLSGTDLSCKVIAHRFLQHFDSNAVGLARAMRWDEDAKDSKGLLFLADAMERSKAKMYSTPQKQSNGGGAQMAAVQARPQNQNAGNSQNNQKSSNSSSLEQKVDKILARLSNVENRLNNLEQTTRNSRQNNSGNSQWSQRPNQNSQNDYRQENRGRSNGRGNSGGNPKRGKSQNRSSNSGLCWAHERFGDKATKCVPPCSRNGQVASPGNNAPSKSGN